MTHRVTQNWLIGLTRFPALTRRFPFLRTLANSYQLTHDKTCSSCGQKASMRVFGNQVNDVAKILATIPETEIAEFKRMTKVDRLSITYMDTRGTSSTIVR